MKKNNLNQSIGIIGGMGPQASAKLLEVLINMAAKEFGAKSDDDFPEIILNSVAVPNFIANQDNIITVRNTLIKRIKFLENFNPSCFGIACNTAHVLLEDLQNNTAVPFVSIMDEVTTKVLSAQISKVGLLGTPVTIKTKLYEEKLTEKNISVVLPSKDEQKIVERVIRNVLSGKNSKKDTKNLIFVANSLKNRGSQGIILGCTELPLIFPKDFSLPVFDSIEILARALLKRFFESKKEK